MKKKLFFVLMICVFATVLAATLVGCGESTLAAPSGLRVTEDGYLAWGTVEGADGYVVYFNEDETERFYLTDNYVSIENKQILTSLKSGEKNSIYIRAVTLGADNLPNAQSPRSRILFNYSRKLSTPNKIKMSKERFSWRGVNGAEDYKAYVVRSGELEGQLYDMTWSTGTASITGTVNDLPNGYMYYVSIVAVAKGYEDSDPSDSVPYDRTNVNMGAKTYVATATLTENGESVATPFSMAVNPDDDNYYVATVTTKAGATLTVADNAGASYAVTPATAEVTGDYVVTLDLANATATATAIQSYYVYVNGEATATKLAFNAATNVYSVNVTFVDGDSFVVKDGAGNLLSTFTDTSVNLGSSVTAGDYNIRVNADGDKQMQVDVQSGSTNTGSSKPSSKDGMWAVTFDYNYAGAPEALVVYATDNRPVATPSTPLRTNYTFEGWYQDSYCLIEAAFGKKQSNFAITCPTTLYAKWSADSGAIVEHTTHVDADKDGKCDVCGATVSVQCTEHKDTNGDGKCDVCGKSMPTVQCNRHKDANGDGKCDICGTVLDVIDVPVDTTGKIYLDVSDIEWFADNGAVINMHIWYGDGTNNTFPGPKMTYNATLGYYEAEYYSSRTVKGVLFTRNNPNPNPGEGETTEWNRVEVSDFVFDANYPVYKVLSCTDEGSTGRWIKVGEQINVTGDGKIYLDYRDVRWFMESAPTNMIYIWYTDGTENAKFPGKQVKYASHSGSTRNACYVDYFTDKTIAGIIFTRNDPALPLGQGVWSKIELSAELGNLAFDPATPAFRVTAWGETFEGYWESEEDALNDVVQHQDDGENLAYFYLNAANVSWFTDAGAVIKAIITYTDNSVNAVDGVTATLVEGLYKWSYNVDKAIKSIVIERVNPTDNLTVWNAFEVTLSANANKDVIVLYSVEGANATYNYASKTSNVQGETRTVYFTDNWKWAEEKGDIYAYVFDSSIAKGVWPGEKMTPVGTNGDGHMVYSYTFSTVYDYVIFNAGSVQTVDIPLGADNAYYITGWAEENKTVNVDTWNYEAPVAGKTLTGITATYKGGDVTVGNEVSPADVEVTATYSDETSQVIAAGYGFVDYDKSTAGVKTITVTYEGKTATIQVTYVPAAEWQASTTMRTIYFTNNVNSEDVFAYVWVGEGENKHELKAWGEKDMAAYEKDNTYGQKVWSYTFSESYTNIIFTFGDKQTVDINLNDLTDNHDAYYPSGTVTNGKYEVVQWKQD